MYLYSKLLGELGGLLAIYDLTGDTMFIDKAKELGGIILAAFGNDDLPASMYNLRSRSMGSKNNLNIAEVEVSR